MEKYYSLQLYRRSANAGEVKLVLSMVREITHETPPLGTWVTINAKDPEWVNFVVQVTSFRQVADDYLVIDLVGEYDRPETRELAPLRAQEILMNANPSWRT